MLSVLITKKKNPQKKLVYNTITTTQALNIPITSSFFWVWRGGGVVYAYLLNRYYGYMLISERAPGGSNGKEAACNVAGSIPGLGRYPGEGAGNLLRYSYLENPMDRGALWATVHGVTKSQI